MDFAARGYLSEVQNSIPPSYTLYTCIRYTYSHKEGGRWGELNQFRESCNSSQSWVEIVYQHS
jgi:hypothetical protein